MSDYEQLKARLRGAQPGTIVAEPKAREPGDDGLAPINEQLVQWIWSEQYLEPSRLRTCSGKQVRILEPGVWNHEAGPDFRMASLLIGGVPVRGDIEIHLHSTDWERHRHERDFDYNSVVLHAFLWLSDEAKFDTRHNGTRIERLELAPALHPDLDTLRRSLAEENDDPDDRVATDPAPGTCADAVRRVDADLLRQFFAAAARERMEARVARYTAQMRTEPPDQVMYQAIMTSMGFKGGKTLLFLLAKRTPLEELRLYLRDLSPADATAALEAILLHVANLAAPPSAPDSAGDPCAAAPADAETQAYVNDLNRWWTEFAGYFEDRIIPPTRRWFSGVRPVNFPVRRLAGVARILVKHDFRAGLTDALMRQMEVSAAREPRTASEWRRAVTTLTQLFEQPADGYWGYRFTLAGKRAARAAHLVGEERARTILFHTLLPLAILQARERKHERLEAYLWRLHDNFPALAENSLVRAMRRRLFADAPPPAGINFRMERYQQALYQIHHECCANAARDPHGCLFRVAPVA
ncbi:MAG: DUF2851 family protein [Candidatus Sumerlaeaceae bacterium]|nr:DUF2851 family protein [Candidatus Sumerlaeaceae bacterium]